MNSELAEFGTQTEQNTDLSMDAQRRPIPYDKTTEEKINHHIRVLKEEFRGDIKIRNCQSDNTSVVSSASSNIPKLVTAGKPSKTEKHSEPPQFCHHKSGRTIYYNGLDFNFKGKMIKKGSKVFRLLTSKVL